jgi:hypothetical protein
MELYEVYSPASSSIAVYTVKNNEYEHLYIVLEN